MSEPMLRTALGNPPCPSGLAVEIVERPLCGMITLRADLANAAVEAMLRSEFGVGVPAVRKIQLAGPNGHAVAWMSPDELMLFCPYDQVQAKLSAIATALAGVHHLAVDVSDARTIFKLNGEGAREVLAKGAPVDLRKGRFGVGDIRRTRLGQVSVAFYQVNDAPEMFELFCFRSVAHYVHAWLANAARAGTLPGVL